mmetsp:Transcript_2703/g.8197  ORF Transcript_2703/g.8197 Transcript_2703/m.8197 type:complete len:533 (-) Transcript_2703:283-1881(-)
MKGYYRDDWDYDALTRMRWRLYIPLSCVVSFVFGSTYSLSAFSLALRNYDQSLLSPYTSALSIQSFVAAFTLCAGAYFLDAYPHRLRELTLFGALTFVLQSAAAYGVQIRRADVLVIVMSIEGLGVGVLYLVGVEHAARWMPDRPGLAMGITMGSMGLGQIFGARCYDALSVYFDSVVTAMHATTAVFVIPPALCAMFIMYPPEGWDPRPVDQLADMSSGNASNNTGVKLGWRLLVQWQFYCLMWIVAMGAGPSFGVLSGFPAVLNGLFGTSPAEASSWFAAMSFVSMVTRFCTGILADLCGYGNGFFWSGGKNLAIVIFSLQTIALVALGPLYRAHSFMGVMSCIAVTFMSFAAAGVLAAIMCRQMFAPRNAGVVFGIAAGLTDGLATMLFGIYMANIEDAAASMKDPADAYLGYFSSTIIWSFVGVVASLWMNKCRAAFEEELDDGDILIYVEKRETKFGNNNEAEENESLVSHVNGKMYSEVSRSVPQNLPSELDYNGMISGSMCIHYSSSYTVVRKRSGTYLHDEAAT